MLAAKKKKLAATALCDSQEESLSDLRGPVLNAAGAAKQPRMLCVSHLQDIPH